MVKHRQLDTDEGALIAASRDTAHSFFCFRCNRRKTGKVQVFWDTKEGRKVLCNACYLEVLERREKRQRKAKKQKVEQVEGLGVLCPVLLERERDEDGKEIGGDEFVELMRNSYRAEFAEHYFQRLQVVVAVDGVDLVGATVDQEKCQGEHLERSLQIVDAVHGLLTGLDEKQQKTIDKVKARLELLVGSHANGDEWAELKSLENLSKLRSVLQTHFGKVAASLHEMMPELKERAGKEPALREEYLQVLSSAAKIAMADGSKSRACKKLLGAAKLTEVFSTKQIAQMDSWISKLQL